MIISEVVTLGIYAFSMIFLPEYFGTAVLLCSPELNAHSPLNRSIIRRLCAFRVESGGHGGGERVAAMDHQVDQEPRRTRGNDEALDSEVGRDETGGLLLPLRGGSEPTDDV
jgi:hypothetical protein